MQEYVTEAIVLAKEPNGDLDSRVSLFTKKFGKLTLKVKSARRLTSKLSPHLDPGNVITARMVEKGGFQLTDVLKKMRIAATPPDMHVLNQLLPEGEPDLNLWQELAGRSFHWKNILRILGWDPSETRCEACANGEVFAFDWRRQNFFCKSCASRAPRNELICI